MLADPPPLALAALLLPFLVSMAPPAGEGASASLPIQADEAPGLPFEDLARRCLAAHRHAPQDPGDPEAFELEGFFTAHYLTAELGLFELGASVHRLQDRAWAEAYRDLSASLLDAQLRWLERVDPLTLRTKDTRADLATVRRWVAKWPAADLSRAALGDVRSVTALLGPKDDVAQAAARLRTAMLSGGGLPHQHDLEGPVRLVLAPTRADFVELMALAGWARPSLRPIFWQAGVDEWLEFSVDDRKVIALQYVAPGRARGDYASGTSMNERTPTGALQQVVQLALLRLVDVYYVGLMPAELGKGLVMNLVIDQFGELQTRVDGDLTANETQKREVFVRGGASEGGRLPQNVAETRWRMDGGKDRYLRVLRQVQKAGKGSREGSKNDQANFLLRSRDESERAIVSAPIFGAAAAKAQAPPEVVQGDYLEFVRAYQCGFVHWLQEHGAGSRKASEQAWARLLETLADPARVQTVDEVLAATYGSPISDADCDPKTLEGKFLRWLSTQR
jgi:hypothetical protein